MTDLPAGKLPPELLAQLLSDLPAPPAEVVVGAQVGEDAAVVQVGGRYLVIASDPVTLSADPGRFAVHVNANDVAVMGAEPRWLLATVLLPLGSNEAQARSVMNALARESAAMGVSLIGGHTEITPTVSRPLVAATMIGEVAPGQLVRSSGARPGDALLLAGPLAIEGTAILSVEYAGELLRRGVSRGLLDEGARLLERPGISVLPAARALTSAMLPHAMHDPTEGGLLSAIREVATASGSGARLRLERVPILAPCRAICDALDLDPLGLLASGSLLAAVDPADIPRALQALRAQGVDSCVIGEILPEREGLLMTREGRERPLSTVERDELARWIESQR